MSKLQGLLFALATVVLVGVSTYLFTKPWLPPLKSDRVAIDDAIWVSLVVTGAVFIVTNLMLAWFGYRYQDQPGAKAIYWHDDPKLEWGWTLPTSGILFLFPFKARNLWASVLRADLDAKIKEATE